MVRMSIMEPGYMQKTGMVVRLRGAIRFVLESIKAFAGQRGNVRSHF